MEAELIVSDDIVVQDQKRKFLGASFLNLWIR